MKRFYIFVICVVLLSSWHLSVFAQNVDFPDANLAAKVRTALGLAADADIPLTSLQGLTSLLAISAGITDLTGLEQATGLERLTLNRNEISDITPLRSLTALTVLQLLNNPISDFDALKSLTNLITLNLIGTKFSDSDFAILSPLTNLTGLILSENEISDLTSLATVLSERNDLTRLSLSGNQISDLSPLGTLTNLTKLEQLTLERNQISDVTPLGHFTSLTQLHLSSNKIRDVTPLRNLINLKWRLYINENQISDLSPLGTLMELRDLRFRENQVSDISPLGTLTELRLLDFAKNRISDLSPLGTLTELIVLGICYNPYTDISPIATLKKLRGLEIDEVFVKANEELVAATTDARLQLCLPLPDPSSDNNPPEFDEGEETTPEPEPKVKPRRSIARCGLGWTPQSQHQHWGELPKVMIYALEFEYDPEGHGRYICKTIEIRTGDDSIENLAGWNLYLGTLYNPSRIPLKIPEEHSQITDRILRITPEMLGLETFPCNTVNGISHPLPGVQYVLKTDENILIDTAYSCFVWGQNAYTTVNGKNVKSKRRISSAVLRQMETPRLERYILDNIGVYITYMNIEAFTWDRVVLSDWLLPSSEPSVPGAPSAIQRKLVTSWGGLKKQ